MKPIFIYIPLPIHQWKHFHNFFQDLVMYICVLNDARNVWLISVVKFLYFFSSLLDDVATMLLVLLSLLLQV